MKGFSVSLSCLLKLSCPVNTLEAGEWQGREAAGWDTVTACLARAGCLVAGRQDTAAQEKAP